MKLPAILLLAVFTAACGSADPSPSPAPTGDDLAIIATAPAPADPNAGTHRYRYVESAENPDNDCSTSAEVGDELSQTITFEDSLVTVVFMRDDLPEGSEPGRRDFDEQIGDSKWREVGEASDGSVLDHTIEFTESGVILTTLRDGESCFYSVRDRIGE